MELTVKSQNHVTFKLFLDETLHIIPNHRSFSANLFIKLCAVLKQHIVFVTLYLSNIYIQ